MKQIENNPLRAVLQNYGLILRLSQPFFKARQITFAQFSVIRALDEIGNEEPITLQHLTRHLLIQPPSLTDTVKKLREAKLIAIKVSSEDRRVKHIQLTSRGKSLLAELAREHPQRLRQILSIFSPQEVQECTKFLERLASHLQNLVKNSE